MSNTPTEIAQLEAKHFALLERHDYALESLRRMVEILEFMGQEKCKDFANKISISCHSFA